MWWSINSGVSKGIQEKSLRLETELVMCSRAHQCQKEGAADRFVRNHSFSFGRGKKYSAPECYMLSLLASCCVSASWRCLTKLSWEGGHDLLGDSAAIWFDSQFGVDLGCAEGLVSAGSSSVCQGSWRFFNLNGAGKRPGEPSIVSSNGLVSGRFTLNANAVFYSGMLCPDRSRHV